MFGNFLSNAGQYPDWAGYCQHFDTSNQITSENQWRGRCNTWPRQEVECPTQPVQQLDSIGEEVSSELGSREEVSSTSGTDLSIYGRRNPWGPQSYAELISLAITSAPGQRMTLNMIYEWLMNNISFFAERRDMEKSAGWKNSIRHNLSLHQKFKKIPNETSGKSSWWVINPEMSPSKKHRRRSSTAGVGDMKMLQNKREKAKEKLEMRRASETFECLPTISEASFDPIPFSRPRSHSVNSSMTSQDSWPSWSSQPPLGSSYQQGGGHMRELDLLDYIVMEDVEDGPEDSVRSPDSVSDFHFNFSSIDIQSARINPYSR